MQKSWDRWAEGNMRLVLEGGWSTVCDGGNRKEQHRREMNWSKCYCGEESHMREMVGMECDIHQPLGWRAPNTGFLQPVSEASQGRAGKISLPHAAEELPPLNLCESFLLPQRR